MRVMPPYSLESRRVPVPSLPSHRSPRDGDPLSGRRGLVGGSRGAAASSAGSLGSGLESSLSSSLLPPALVARDGRGAVTILNEARGQAEQFATDLEHLDTAEAGLSQVQRLVGRLRDVAVVALDRGLQPAQRAGLQRQVDLALGEIDTVASETLVDQRLVRGGTPSALSNDAQESPLTPFRTIGTSLLGISELAVRSPDQALAATGALDVASSRLQRSGSTLSSATARLQDALDELLSPQTTVTGEIAIPNQTLAQSTAMTLRDQLLTYPDQAAQAQVDLDLGRVRWLLDSHPR
jgi:flagellin